VRILGGSLEQSLRMWEHLFPDLTRLVEPMLNSRAKSTRRISLTNGSGAAVLTQSEYAVRGIRVQKLRCDEVEQFKPHIWEAAQLVTRSRNDRVPISGAIEAISTFHKPWGLMSRIIDQARARRIPVIHWCILDVLERCPPERDCATCPLWDECKGVAKTRCDGFVSIDDAIAMKMRVSKQTWENEMLCLRPSSQGSVFPTFRKEVHVKEVVREEVVGVQGSGFSKEERNPRPNSLNPEPRTLNPHLEPRTLNPSSELSLTLDFGFAAPFVCLWIRSFSSGITHVIDEYIQRGVTMDQHVEHIRSRPHGTVTRVACDPAGAGRNDQTATSNITLLRQSGFKVCARRSKIVDGLEMIRTALSPAFGEPKLFIHPRCAKLIKSMQAYHYPPGGGEVPWKDGEYDHLIDALRYHFVNRPTVEKGPPRRY
jgi:hypothetical protein